MGGPRPSVGRANRDYGSDGPGAFRYGRSGTLNEGQNYHNSYNTEIQLYFHIHSHIHRFTPFKVYIHIYIHRLQHPDATLPVAR